MNRRNPVFNLSSFYFVCLSALVLFFLSFLLLKGHAETFLILNANHHSWLDRFFALYTHAGDGLFAVLVCFVLFLFLKTQRLSIVLLSSFIASGLLAQLFKRIIDTPRPIGYFTLEQYNKYIDGVHNAALHSFPSGHTTTAFAIATVLACYTNKKALQLTYLLLAVLVGYSRIYLGQHFLTDVLGGAILGTLISLLSIKIANRIAYKKPVSFISKKERGIDS